MSAIEINRVTVAIPARQFAITAAVTVNESLPKVTEFILRLIRLCDGLAAEEIQRFFGLSAKECRLVLDSMIDQSLISYEGELVTLTRYAEEKFYTDDDLPRFSVVKPRTDLVDFDLLTFHPIEGRGRNRAPPFAMELKQDEGKISSSNRLAELAYQRHFHSILRQKEHTLDKVDIYKMSGVQAKRFFEIPLDVTFALQDTGDIDRTINFDEEPEDYRLAVETAVSDAVSRPLSLQGRALSEFVDRFDDKVIGQFLSTRGFDLGRYIDEVFRKRLCGYADHTYPLIGASYLPANQELIVNWWKAAFSEPDGEPSTFQTSAAWLAPSHDQWGRSTLMLELYLKLQGLLVQPKKMREPPAEQLHILYPSSSEMTWQVSQRFWSKPEKSIHYCATEAVDGTVEVLLVPTKFACVLLHYAPPGNSSALVPFGFVTRAPHLVKEAQVLVLETLAQGEGYLGRYQKDGKLVRDFEEFSGFLSYCAA